MKTKISSILIFLFLSVCSAPSDTMAQSQHIIDLKNSVYIDLDNISDRVCCYTSFCNNSDRPPDCIPRVSDAAICGECKNHKTGEVGIYTQDLSQPHPDTTVADNLGNLITHNSRIKDEIATITAKQMNVRKSIKAFEMKWLFKSGKPTGKEKKEYESALKLADLNETDLSILHQLQSDIYKLSSDLFLLSLSNRLK